MESLWWSSFVLCFTHETIICCDSFWVGLVHLLTPRTGLGRAWGEELPFTGAVAFYIASAHTDAPPVQCPGEQHGVKGRNFGWLEQFGSQDTSLKGQSSRLMFEVVFSSLSYFSTTAVISDTSAVVISIACAFSSISSSALAEGIILCLRSAYWLENMLFEEVFVEGFISTKSDVRSLQFHAWFQSCWHRVVHFVWRPAKARVCFLFWGTPLEAGHHLSCPHSSPNSAQGGTPRSDPSQCDSACRLLERFAHHQAAPGLLLSLSVPSFPPLFKKVKSLTASLPNWIETSSLRTFFLLFNSINPSIILFLTSVY